MQHPITHFAQGMLAARELQWELCAFLPHKLRDDSGETVDSTPLCGKHFSLIARDALLAAVPVRLSDDLSEDAGDVPWGPFEEILALRDALEGPAMATHCTILNEPVDSYLRAFTEAPFTGDNMMRFSSASIRIAQFNIQGCTQGIRDGGATGSWTRLLRYMSAMRVTLAGVSEVDCRDKERVALLRGMARKSGYELVVSMASTHGGSVAFLSASGMKVDGVEVAANGRGVQCCVYIPAGPIRCICVYGRTGGTAANPSRRVLEQELEIGDYVHAAVEDARLRRHTALVLGDCNSLGGVTDCVDIDPVVRPDSLASRLIHKTLLCDSFRLLHPDVPAVTFVPPAARDANERRGNRLDYIFTSAINGIDRCCLRPVRSGIHEIGANADLNFSDHYHLLADMVLDCQNDPMGCLTGELARPLRCQAFQRSFASNDLDFVRRLNKTTKDMAFTPAWAELLSARLGSCNGRTVETEGIVSESAHMLVHSALEVVRLVSGRASARSMVLQLHDDERALLRMMAACSLFISNNQHELLEEATHAMFFEAAGETDADRLQLRESALRELVRFRLGYEAPTARRAVDRATSLLHALQAWGGRAINIGVDMGGRREGGGMRLEALRLLGEFLDDAQPRCRFSREMLHLVDTIRSDCLAAVGSLQQAHRHEHEGLMTQALQDNDMGMFFRLLDGRTSGAPSRHVSAPAGHHRSPAEFKQAVDAASATLRQAGVGRDYSPFLVALRDPLGGQTYVPHAVLVHQVEPSAETIAGVMGCNVEDVSPDILAFVRCLWLHGTRGLQDPLHDVRTRAIFESLARPTSIEEIKKVSRGWSGKATGITGFQVGMVWWLPDPYQRLLVSIVDAQLKWGVCPRSMCEGLLVQLLKPEGGHRGLLLGEDMIKLVTAICMHRLAKAQRGLPPGTISSPLNVAYTRSAGTDQVHLALDLISCKARLRRECLIVLEYDLYKFFDQIDRRWLVGILVLLGMGCLVPVFDRRYYSQRLVSDTVYGLTTGFARGPYGIDQGATDSPILSQIYQKPFLDALQLLMQARFLAGFLICAFADNHYVAWVVPRGTVGFFSPLGIISTLLWLCCMVVKPSSVRVRRVNAASAAEVDIGSLFTNDHISGVMTEVVPSVVPADECPRILGVPFSGDCSFATESGAYTSNLSYHLHCCTARQVSLLFFEVVLRAYFYARAQYGAVFQVLEWSSIAAMAKRVEHSRRLRLGLPSRARLDIALLPYGQGGLNLTMLHLEGFVIPWVRGIIHLLNLDNDLGVETRTYITHPDAARQQEPGNTLRVEVAMRRLAPYGILVLSNRHNMVGRALSIAQVDLAGRDKSPRPLVKLDQCPTEKQVTVHSVFVLGGPLHCILVTLMPAIKLILDRLRPTDLGLSAGVELQALLMSQGHGCPGFGQLGSHNLWGVPEWLALGHALVSARRESDSDLALQRQAAGLPPSNARHWPDWPGDEDPFIPMWDDLPPCKEVVNELAVGRSFLVATDGSATVETDQAGHTTTLKAGSAVVVFAVTDDNLESMRQIVSVKAPFPLQLGWTQTTSAETEANALLILLRLMGSAASQHTHTVVDSQATLAGCERLISSEVPGTIDPTPREIRSWRGAPLWQRLARLMRNKKIGWIKGDDVHEAGGNRMWGLARVWRAFNNLGVRVSEMRGWYIDFMTISWIRSHQTGDDKGPVPAAVMANETVDARATEASNESLIKLMAIGPAGVVRIPNGTSPCRLLYKGWALDGDPGALLRQLATQAIHNELRTSRIGSAAQRVVTRRWGPLSSPHVFVGARVRNRPVDIRESMYATQLGYYGHLDGYPDGTCKLCGEISTRYSTAHALSRCTHPPLVELRTAMLVAVNQMLRDSDVTLPVPWVGEHGRGNLPTVIDAEVTPSLVALSRAGDFLLNGDIEALRGVPLAFTAELMCTTGVTSAGEKIARVTVVQALRDITALIVLDGQHILVSYKKAVEELLRAQEQQED